MSARDLLERAVATGVTILADDGELVLRGDQSAIASLVPDAKAHKAELLAELRATNDGAYEVLPDAATEARQQRVLAMLDKSPDIKYALTDTGSDPVLLTLAIRGKATCEFQIPRDKYDGVLLLELLERHGGTIH